MRILNGLIEIIQRCSGQAKLRRIGPDRDGELAIKINIPCTHILVSLDNVPCEVILDSKNEEENF